MKALGLLAVLAVAGCTSPPAEAPRRLEPVAERWTVEAERAAGDAQAVLVAPDGARTVLAEAPADRLTVGSVSPDLFEVRTSCGSPCSASVYVSARTGRVSDAFDDVLAPDAPRERVAVPTPRGVAVYGLWDEVPLVDAALPLSAVANPASAFSSATFRPDGTLDVAYLTGEEFGDAAATVAVAP